MPLYQPENRLINVVDRTSLYENTDVSEHFAFEEYVCRRVGNNKLEPTVYLWRHPQAMVLGNRDFKLPGAPQAVQWLISQGKSVFVRHSGGALVPLDKGVVNVSIVIPHEGSHAGYQSDFERMYMLLKDFLKTIWGVEIAKGMVSGSYCPGQFDLSINGMKFCGISQRRTTRAVIIHAFLLIEGTGSVRAASAQAFYRMAADGRTDLEYPEVRPDCMVSLQELNGLQSITVEQWTEQFVQYLSRQGSRILSMEEIYNTRSETT